MALEIAVIGLVISGGALGVSAASLWFARRQLQLAERLRVRDFEAIVVVELEEWNSVRDRSVYKLRVTNAGPAVARDVSVEIVEFTDEKPLGFVLGTAAVAPVLLRGEQRTVTVEQFWPEDEDTIAVNFVASYFDDNGVRNEQVA